MTSFIFRIPMAVLAPFVALMVAMAVYLVEVVAYYRYAGWYYRTGPAIMRERWQTTGTATEIRQAIRPLLGADDLVGRESAEGFHLRQRAISINAWTRILLRIEETDRGVALYYEVRPFYSFAPFILPVVWLVFGTFGGGRIPLWTTVAAIVIVFAIYKWILPWDVSRMGRLPSVRRALARYGLRVCERCGYDLFGHADGTRCPECGTSSPTP